MTYSLSWLGQCLHGPWSARTRPCIYQNRLHSNMFRQAVDEGFKWFMLVDSTTKLCLNIVLQDGNDFMDGPGDFHGNWSSISKGVATTYFSTIGSHLWISARFFVIKGSVVSARLPRIKCMKVSNLMVRSLSLLRRIQRGRSNMVILMILWLSSMVGWIQELATSWIQYGEDPFRRLSYGNQKLRRVN